MTNSQAKFRVGVDIGGTFTDIVARGAQAHPRDPMDFIARLAAPEVPLAQRARSPAPISPDTTVCSPRTSYTAALADDYARMFDDGLLPDDAEPFQALMSTCEQIANRANR